MASTLISDLQKVSNEFSFDCYRKTITTSEQPVAILPTSHHQLLYCLDHSGALQIDGHIFTVPKTYLLIIRKNAHPFQCFYPTNSHIVQIGFKGNLNPLLLNAQSLYLDTFLLPLKDSDWQILTPISDKLYVNSPYADFILNTWLNMMQQQSHCEQLLQHYHPIIRRAICYIHNHFHLSLSIQDIATYCATKPRYLAYLFRQELDVSPSKYLSHFRINRAKALLLDYSIKIEHIAYKIGYQNISIFSKTFKRYTNYSPSEWRAIFYHPQQR